MARPIGLWAEAWTVPGAGVGLVTKKVAHIPVVEGDWLDPLSEVGRGSCAIPAAHSDLSLILDPEGDEYSMVRIRRPNGTFGGALVYSWLARRFEDRESDREVDLANVTGPGIDALLGVPILPYDYPLTDAEGRSFDPDWEWGSTDNLVRNNGVEEPGESIPNPSFESGFPAPWQPGAVDGVSATASVLSDGGHDGADYMRVVPLLPEGGASVSVDVYPNSDYTFTAWVRADTGLRYQVGASGPETIRAISPGSAVVEAYPSYDQGHEAHYSFLGNGSFQLATLVFRTGPEQTSTMISIRDFTDPANLQPFDVDFVGITGIGIGMSPWEPTHPPHIVSTFEVSQLVTPFEGDYHGHIVSAQFGGGKQRIAGVNPGETFTFSVRLQSLVAGHRWGIEVKDMSGQILFLEPVFSLLSGGITHRTAQETMELTGPGTWDLLQMTFTIPVELARGSEIEIWIVNHHPAVSTVYFDDVHFYHGLPAATYGEIMKVLLDDLALDHAPGFEALTSLKYDSFDETNNSNAVPWTETHSYRAEVGKSILNVAEDFAQRGYEFEVVDLDGADLIFDVELNIYPPSGLGTVLTTDESVAMVAGTNVLPTEIVRSAPVANDVTVQGADRLVVRVEDAASIATAGRIGTYVSAPELTGLQTVTERANQELANRIVPVSLRPTVLESDVHSTPYYDFSRGDTVLCVFPPKVPAQGRRVMSIAGRWSGANEFAIFDIDTDRRVFASNPMLGLTRAVDILWRKFTGRVRVPDILPLPDSPGGFGTVPTIFVASVEARDSSWAAAHYRMAGVDDDVILQTAADELDALGGGRLVFSEGGFYWGSTGNLDLPNDVMMIGMGIGATIIWVPNGYAGSVFTHGNKDTFRDFTVGKLALDT